MATGWEPDRISENEIADGELTIGLFTSMEISEVLLVGIENLQKGWSN